MKRPRNGGRDDLNEYWLYQHRKLHEAFHGFSRLQDEDPAFAKVASRKKLRKYWKTVSETLSAYSYVVGMLGDAPHPFPHDILLRMSNLLEDVAVGFIPPHLEQPRATDGGKLRSFTERRVVSTAVFYLQAVDRKEIQSSSPVKNVADAYALDRQTVRNWRKEGLKITEGIEKPPLSSLHSFLERDGAKYQQLGFRAR